MTRFDVSLSDKTAAVDAITFPTYGFHFAWWDDERGESYGCDGKYCITKFRIQNFNQRSPEEIAEILSNAIQQFKQVAIHCPDGAERVFTARHALHMGRGSIMLIGRQD